MELREKVAIVTGSSRGLGRAIALSFAEKGVKVVVNYNSNEKAAEETVRKIEGMGGNAIKVKADVRRRNEVRKMVELAVEEFGSIDILVNNAGVSGKFRSIRDITDDDWKNVIDINLTGAFIVTQEVLRYMEKGKIINISSVAGRMGGVIGAHYAASKAGLIGFTFSLARELAPDILVNAIAPGPIDTEIIDQQTKDTLARIIPLGRIATPEEIAHAVIFVAENDYLTGSVIDINGGRHML
ncbi:MULTISPECIES: 3-oxoacyl-ACP reductase family protein [unclassified Archaeoglobus]|uniref:3-oxoacyl-ACP reductase family protein n=1 Tax=unclassified Archaeoglobus TaxID=2643606 RepID=UPI0025B944EE|nr:MULTISPECIES: 3-oxoacyl-ACP reductase family protein [unclassified Archaeoglobus]